MKRIMFKSVKCCIVRSQVDNVGGTVHTSVVRTQCFIHHSHFHTYRGTHVQFATSINYRYLLNTRCVGTMAYTPVANGQSAFLHWPYRLPCQSVRGNKEQNVGHKTDESVHKVSTPVVVEL